MTEPDQQAELARQRAHEIDLAVRAELAELAERRADTRATSRRPVDTFQNTPEGNAHRFGAQYVDVFRCDDTGARTKFYRVNSDRRWMEDFGAEAIVAASRVLTLLRERADAIVAAAEGGTDQEVADARAAATALRDWARRCANRSSMSEMARLGCELHGMMVRAEDQFDTEKTLLVAHNVALKLTDKGVEPRWVSPDDMVTFSTNARWNPEWFTREPPPEVTDYFKTFIPDENRRRMIQKVLGSSVLGGNKHRLAIFLLGKTTTGKSQLSEVLQLALGDYCSTGSASIFRGNMDDKPRPDIIRAMKRRVVILSEASDDWELHGDRLKDLTGGGNITARAMHSNTFVDMVPQFTPLVVTNEMPRMTGMSPAARRRMMVIRFDQQPQAEDINVKKRFLANPEVREWFLFWLLHGYALSEREGLEDAERAFALDTLEAFAAMDHVGEFLDFMRDADVLVDDEVCSTSQCVTTGELHERYVDWCKRHGDRRDRAQQLGPKQFMDRLVQQYGWQWARSSGTRWVGKRMQLFVPENAFS